MNTLSSPTITVKPLTFAAGTSIPYIWGAQDAAAGQPCVPEMQWVRRSDQRDYAAGFASVSGPTMVTRQFVGAN